MRVVFLGTPDSAVPSLEALARSGATVPLVVTRPDRPVGRRGTPQPPPVKEAAARLGLPVIQPAKVRKDPAPLERIRSERPDFLAVVAYGKILPASLLDTARRACVNVHFSLLPSYRGAAPVQWALARGETVTGVSTMRMSEGLDEGDVLLQEAVAIEAGERAPSLTRRLAHVGAALLVRTLEGLEAGAISPRPQDHARASFAPLLTREDGCADFSMSAEELEGRVRGFDPWPGVWAATATGRRVRLVTARAISPPAGERARPGTVVGVEGDAVVVACGGRSTLAVAVLHPEGRRRMTGREAVNGRHLSTGSRLERPRVTG